jgi:hypothetical protein
MTREKVLIKSYHERFGDLLLEMWMGIRYCFVGKEEWGDLGKIDERFEGKFEGNLRENWSKIEGELTRLDNTSEEVV